MDIGRNAPCPCGSGKKYKKCCLGKKQSGPLNSTAEDVFGGLREAFNEQQFNSLEEVRNFAEGIIQQKGQAPLDDFDGLSPEQMHRIPYLPFASPQLVDFPDCLDLTPTAPILTLFDLLQEAIGPKGMKPTATGNLPRKFCREAALAYWGEEGYRDKTRYGNINKENDFSDLHATRMVAELAGLIRKYKGRFILSRKCRSLMTEAGLSAVFPRLFRAFVQQFNWGYRDGYSEIRLIEQSFLFTLYLLDRYGDDWRLSVFYEDCFLKAFPAVLKEMEPNPFYPAENQIRSCYTLRAIKRFIGFLGLATVEPAETDKPFGEHYRLKKRPLLDATVRFHLKIG